MRLSSDPQGAYRGAVPRGMIVVLLVLLAAGLAAWLLVDSGASGVRQGHLGEDATPLEDERTDGSLRTPDLAAQGTAVASPHAGTATPGPWGLPVIVEGAGGSPLAGARVEVRRTQSLLFEPNQEGCVLATGRTDAQGRAFLADLSTPGVELNVTADGHAPRTLLVSLPSPGVQPAPTRVRLWPPGTTLHITVRSVEGEPLERARVFIYDSRRGMGRHQQLLLTDASGEASAPLGPWRRFHVVVQRPGFGSILSGGDVGTLEASARLDIQLAPAQEVSGRFVAQPPYRVPPDLSFRAGRAPPEAAATSSTWTEVSPEDHGRFRVWWVRAPEQTTGRIALFSRSYEALGGFAIDLTQPTTDLELDLTPQLRDAGSVAVEVQYPDGRPAAGLAVQVDRVRTRGPIGLTPGVLDAQGRAELPWPKDLDPPTSVAVFDNQGIRHHLRAEDRVEGVFRMRRYGTAHGQVTAADGARVPEAVVAFYPQSDVTDGWRYMNASQVGMWQACDAQGEFRCAGLAPGHYHVVGGANASEVTTTLAGTPVIEVKAGETAEVGVVRLQPRQLLRGRLRDADGQPVPGVFVVGTVQAAGGEPWIGRDESDEEGAFELPLAHLGHISVYVSDPRWPQPYEADLVEPLQPLELVLAATPVLVVRFQRRTPPDGASAKLCLSPVGAPKTHTLGGTIFGHELRVRLPANLEPDTAYEGWIECGDYLGDVTPLPTDLSGPGPHVMSMWTRLPEDDDE